MMKFDLQIIKSKLLDKRPVKTNKNEKGIMKLTKKSTKNSVVKQDPLQQIKKFTISYFSKDKKAKRVMKQSERGIIMIIGAIIIGYGAYALLYQPSVSKHDKVLDEFAKTEHRRQDIVTHLNNQASLLKSIDQYNNKLNEYKIMYPNYRTQNEILKVISDLLAKEGISPATFVKGETKMAQKSIMQTFISNKQLQDKVLSYKYFGGAGDKDKSAANQQSNQDAANGTIPDADKTNFQYTQVSFSVDELTKQRALNIMDTFSKSKRIIIPESWNMSSTGTDGKYRLEATVLFFAYRDQDSPESLF